MPQNGQVRLAVVGLGAFGRRYLRALKAMSGVEIAWCADLDAAYGRRVAAEFAVPHFTTDIGMICADASVDAVLIVTPEAAHRALAVAALNAGKHVLVEKPLATTEDDALAMIDAANRSGKLLMTGFLLRFDYRYAQLKQRLGDIGTIRSLYAYRNFDRSLFALYSRTHSFVENAIHDIDLILWYVDSPVRRAHGFCRNTQALPNPDVNWGVLEFENGTLAVLQTSWLYPPQTQENLQWNAGIQVMGDKGVLEVANDAGGFRANTEETGLALLDQTGWADIHGEARGAFGAMLRHFIACLRGETPYRGTTPTEALEAMRVACRLVADSETPERAVPKEGNIVSAISKENAARLLTDLIAIPSVNPMGRPYDQAETVERGVADYMEDLFAPYGVRIERDPYNATHENLLLVVPGQSDGPYTLFESHMDTVPADDWSDRAFTPRREGDLIFGRGACDDKGCLAAMTLAVLAVLESGTPPASPILFLAAGDEEYAQTGIKRFRDYPYAIGRGIFGEPTNGVPVVQHKGTVRWDITVQGRSAHTSRPELGINAILGAMEVIAALREHQRALQKRYISPLMTGPLLTVSMIHGGRTRNAVPDECTLSVDFRIVPGMELEAAQEEVFEVLAALNLEIIHSEAQLKTPPLNTLPTDPFARHVLEICRQYLDPETGLEGVPYGTDAAWVSDRAPALVLGPGSIVSAHAVDEHIDVNEVVQCAEIYRQILVSDYSQAGG